jgi:ribosomal protein L37AE/L43A
MDEHRPLSEKELRKKPLTKEDQYFLEQAELARIQAEQARAAKEKEKLKELHWMRCPKCGHEMVEEEHEKILVDRCTNCQGVFLDADEVKAVLGKSQKAGFLQGFVRSLVGP